MDALSHNHTVIFYTEFVLFGFPGILRFRKLLVIPFLVLYITILAGNILIIHQVFIQPKLHSPMYFLMCLLFTVNISCTTSFLPKFLLGLSFDVNGISLVGCLLQMFFIYFLGGFESATFLMMGVDRFVAICRPLRYNNIMTKRFIGQLIILGLARSMFLVTPTVILTSTVRFCRSNIIQNVLCENMGLLSLACDDISKLHVMGLLARIFITVVDFTLLVVTYVSILMTTMNVIVGRARHKALHTCFIHLAVGMPIYVCSLLSSVVYRLHTHISFNIQNMFSVFYLTMPAATNPFIYGIGVTEIRQSIIRTWKMKDTSRLS